MRILERLAIYLETTFVTKSGVPYNISNRGVLRCLNVGKLISSPSFQAQLEAVRKIENRNCEKGGGPHDGGYG